MPRIHCVAHELQDGLLCLCGRKLKSVQCPCTSLPALLCLPNEWCEGCYKLLPKATQEYLAPLLA